MNDLGCTFFGEHDCPDSIEPILRETIIKLINRYGVIYFFVGNDGKFDRMVTKVLKELENYYYDIYISVTLAYFPKNDAELYDRFTQYPFLTETIPDREAIDYRDEYMLENSNYVIAYVTNNRSTAKKYVRKALKENKTVINLAELIEE